MFSSLQRLPDQAPAPEHHLKLPASKLRSSPWLLLDYWHLLSLDAPTVAVVWLRFVDRCAGLPADYATAAALFLTVWALYAGDRLLDARALARSPQARMLDNGKLELRHHFHHAHRRTFTAALVGIVPVLLYLIFHVPAHVLGGELLLAVLLAGWLMVVHAAFLHPSSPQQRLSNPLPKEFPVGVFFGAAVSIPALVLRPAAWAGIMSGAVLFCGVCTLNCLFLYAWEHPEDVGSGHPATRWALDRLVPLAGCTLAASLVAVLLGGPLLAAVALACALSTALLLTLHVGHRHFDPLRLRALADLVLLSPLLLSPMLLSPLLLPAHVAGR